MTVLTTSTVALCAFVACASAAPNNYRGSSGHGATIYGSAFIDGNGNGRRDYWEAGLAGVTVQMGEASVDTDANGRFVVRGLQPGAYSVGPVGQAGPVGLVFAGSVAQVQAAAGQNFRVQLPYRPQNAPASGPFPAVIGSRVYRDANNNGAMDQSDPGVPGVRVSLLDATGAIVQTATTDADGSYALNVPAGAPHTVQVDRSSLAQNARPAVNIFGQTLGWAYTVTLGPGQVVTDGNFGFVF